MFLLGKIIAIYSILGRRLMPILGSGGWRVVASKVLIRIESSDLIMLRWSYYSIGK